MDIRLLLLVLFQPLLVLALFCSIGNWFVSHRRGVELWAKWTPLQIGSLKLNFDSCLLSKLCQIGIDDPTVAAAAPTFSNYFVGLNIGLPNLLEIGGVVGWMSSSAN